MAMIVGFAQNVIDKLYHYGLPFVVVLSILVFVHEFGHFWVARRCGVRIEAFSIGFGKELFGWTDRLGTRWRVGWLPVGGFVKMYGDADASSRPDTAAAALMDPQDRRVSFVHKKVWQRALIVGAGPATNFLFAILLFSILFATIGQPYTPPVIGKVMPDSAAEQAGLQAGDVVQSVDGVPVSRFEDLMQMVMVDAGEPLHLAVLRKGEPIDVSATPRVTEEASLLGAQKVGRLGIQASSEVVMRRENPLTAVWEATRETWTVTSSTLETLGQMVIGRRSTDGLSGPIGIGQLSGEIWKQGFIPLVRFIALLSISLGLINLFPIPVLDGGHLLFYAIEAVRGEPASDRALAVGFRVGFALIVSFFVFVMWHDLSRLIHVTSGT
jgi:regulator of sigma E protease